MNSLSLNFSPYPVIETERLVLRRLESADVEGIYYLRSDPGVNKYVNRSPALELKDAVIFIETINQSIDRNDVFYWGIVLKEKNQLVGTICLWNISPNDSAAETGYELMPEFQGNGYVSEALNGVMNFAFEKIGLASIYAYVHPENERSKKILDKFGFKYVGLAEEGNEVIYKKDKTETEKINNQG